MADVEQTFAKVCKISIHVSSGYQNLGVNVLAKLSKWRRNNMHLIHTSHHHWNHDHLYMWCITCLCDKQYSLTFNAWRRFWIQIAR